MHVQALLLASVQQSQQGPVGRQKQSSTSTHPDHNTTSHGLARGHIRVGNGTWHALLQPRRHWRRCCRARPGRHGAFAFVCLQSAYGAQHACARALTNVGPGGGRESLRERKKAVFAASSITGQSAGGRRKSSTRSLHGSASQPPPPRESRATISRGRGGRGGRGGGVYFRTDPCV